jgi:hypothetical protein
MTSRHPYSEYRSCRVIPAGVVSRGSEMRRHNWRRMWFKYGGDRDKVEREYFSYINRKNAEERFQMTSPPQEIPSYDLIERKEIIS